MDDIIAVENLPWSDVGRISEVNEEYVQIAKHHIINKTLCFSHYGGTTCNSIIILLGVLRGQDLACCRICSVDTLRLPGRPPRSSCS